MGISPFELAIVAGIVILLFGVKKIPELGSGLGQAISNFKKSYKDGSAIDVTPRSEDAPPAKQESPKNEEPKN